MAQDSTPVESKLSGEIIGTAYSYNTSTGQQSSTVNTKQHAFDGDPETFFCSYSQDMTWAGYDLGTAHVITRVGIMPRNVSGGPEKTLLGVFEGANDPDFMDAVPLYLISQTPSSGQITYYPVNVSRGFRYVRYVSPASARCQVAELEFYGYEGAGDDTQFYQITGIPTVSIHVYNNDVPTTKGEDFESNVTIVYDDGTLIQEYPILTRVRGNFSSTHVNKPYRIKFNDGNSHHMLKGSLKDESPAKAKKWTLINSYRDKTLIRNTIAFEMSRWVGLSYTPWCRNVDLLLNGEYRGTYLLCDWLGVDKNRVNITEMTEDCVEGDLLTGGYFFEANGYANSDPVHFTSSRGTTITVHSPDDDAIQDAQFNYLKNHYKKMEESLYSSDYTDPETGYRAYLDVESFLKYILSNEYCNNTDMLWQVFMYKERGDDHIYTGPVWDHDLALENDNVYYPVDEVDTWTYQVRGVAGMREMTSRVLSDPLAMARMQEMWGNLRDSGVMTEESVTAYVDSLRERVRESATLNHIRWPYLLQNLPNNPGIWGSWEAEVDHVLNSMIRRLNWMDKKLRYNMLDLVDGFYQISSPLDLMTFIRFVNQKYELEAKAALTADLDLENYQDRFEPIGSAVRPFKGEFDGKSHVISNLHVEGAREVGFFGVVADGATISNLTFDSSCSFSGTGFVGSVIGTLRKGSAILNRCGNEATITATESAAGGLVGRSRSGTLDITDSYNVGSVTAASNAAALVGSAGGAVKATNCYNAGLMTGMTEGKDFVVSTAEVTLQNCYDLYGSQAEAVTQDAISSGELCHILNLEGLSANWRQNIDNGKGRDRHPVLLRSHGQVFKTNEGYTNVNPNLRGYRYYLIDITGIQGGGTYQFAEFNLLNSTGEAISDVKVYNGLESNISHENWPNGADYMVETKYCGSFNGRIWLMLDAGEEVSVAGYRFYTANDTQSNSGRNPSTWRFCGTNEYTEDPDDEAWEVLDEKENDYTLKATNFTPYDFMLDSTIEKFVLTPSIANMNPGEKMQLELDVTPSNIVLPDLSWSSSDTSVATVDGNGLVTAVGLGKATVTVTMSDLGGLTAECQITVTNDLMGYRYYMLEINALQGDGVVQLSEVDLIDAERNEFPSLSVYDGPDEFFSNESWENLCDDKTTTKYCGEFNSNEGVYIFFDAASRVKPAGYRLYTANDTQSHSGRNPKTWKLWGSESKTTSPSAKSWVLLDERTDDSTLGAYNYKPYDFFIDWSSIVSVENVGDVARKVDSVFDLQGRRVLKPKKGIYIMNGRKILVK